MKSIKKYMLQIISLVLAVLCLVACSARSSEIRDYCSESQVEFLDRLETEKPVSAVYYQNGEASNRFTITDTETICALAQALCEIQIESPTELYSTDSDNVFVFMMEDGKNYSFNFNEHNFEAKDQKCYTTSNGAALWTLASQISEKATNLGS